MTDGHCELCGLADEFDSAARAPVSFYEAAKLHDRNERSWGVVGMPYGALAEDASGGLLMRLTEAEAHEIAQLMSVRLAILEKAAAGLPSTFDAAASDAPREDFASLRQAI